MLTVLWLLLAAQSAAVNLSGEWVGPLEFRDHRGLSTVPTHVTLTVKDRMVTGRAIGLNFPHGSSDIAGTIDDKGRWRLHITMHGGRIIGNELTSPEACSGTAEFSGTVTRSRMLRWTAHRLILDTPAKRQQERDCANLSHLVWILQRRDLKPPGH